MYKRQASEKSIGIQMSTSPKTIATVHEFHLHYSDFYDCGFKSLVMVAFVNGFFNPESRKIFVKEGYFVIFKEKKIAHCIGAVSYTHLDVYKRQILNLLDKYELGEMKWDSTQNYYMVQKPEIR